MKRLLVVMVLFSASICLAQNGYIHGSGAPTSATNCAGSRFYIDDSTALLYVAGTGSPCTWALSGSGSGLSNPMTTLGDLIKGGASGTPARLALGTNGQYLGVRGGAIGYFAIQASDVPTLNQNTSGTAALATALAATPTQCGGGQYATGVAASGNANCGTPSGASPNVTNTVGTAGASQTFAPTTNTTLTELNAVLSANLTVTLTQPANSAVVRMQFVQANAGGPYTVTVTGARWAGGVAPTMTAAANAVDWWTCMLDGTHIDCTASQDMR